MVGAATGGSSSGGSTQVCGATLARYQLRPVVSEPSRSSSAITSSASGYGSRPGSWPSRRREPGLGGARELEQQHVPGQLPLLEAGLAELGRVARPRARPGGRPRSGATVAVTQATARAPVVADHVRPLDPELVQDGEHVADERHDAVGVDVGRLVGPPVAALVGDDHLEAGLDEGRHLVAPEPPRVGEPVEEHHGRALARHLDLDTDPTAVDADGPSSFPGGHGSNRSCVPGLQEAVQRPDQHPVPQFQGPVRIWLFVIFEMVANKYGFAAREPAHKYHLTEKTVVRHPPHPTGDGDGARSQADDWRGCDRRNLDRWRPGKDERRATGVAGDPPDSETTHRVPGQR